MTVILFIVILAALVFVHELGHFVMAKIFGIRVDEFALGFPPKIIGFKKGETEYNLNLIPLGGYVKIFGEDVTDETTSGPDSKRSFINAAKWKQIVVLLAGILMNIIFAWILISISFNFGMLTSIENQYASNAKNVSVMVLSVLKDSPSEIAGLKEGDTILEIDSGKTKIISPSTTDIQNIISESNQSINIEYQRANATGTVNIVATNGIVAGKKAIGISMGLVGIVKYGFFQSFVEGAKLTAIEVSSIAQGIYGFIVGAFKGQSGLLSQITGPVGIEGMVGQASSMGISYLLGFIALISINLAMLNLVPFPALDGGRILFVLIETVIRKRIKPAIANWANTIGFVLLIALMLFVTYKDILRLIK
jgi:regulator of sigma E protease